MNLIFDTHTDGQPGMIAYADLAGMTQCDLTRYLTVGGVEAILLRNTVAPIHLSDDGFEINLSRLDKAFIHSVRNSHIRTMLNDLHARIADPSLPACEPDHVLQAAIADLDARQEELCITKKNIKLLRDAYGITRSPKVAISERRNKTKIGSPEKTNVSNTIVTGCRKQYTLIADLIEACEVLGITVDVERDLEYTAVTDIGEVANIAATFSLERTIDVHVGTKTIGLNYIVKKADVTHIHESLKALRKDPAFHGAKYIFMNTGQAKYFLGRAEKSLYPFDAANVTYYGGLSRKLDRRSPLTVLVGVPRFNPNTSFTTDYDHELSVLRYKRFHILRAISGAKTVYCIGLSGRYLGDVLQGIPGISYIARR